MAKKKVEWVIMMGDGRPLWEEGSCQTRQEARNFIADYRRDIFEPWYAGVVHPLTILRREWAMIEERKVR